MSKENHRSRIPSPKDESDVVHACAFCGKEQREVERLIPGPKTAICNECVEICNEVLDEEGLSKRPLLRKPEIGIQRCVNSHNSARLLLGQQNLLGAAVCAREGLEDLFNWLLCLKSKQDLSYSKEHSMSVVLSEHPEFHEAIDSIDANHLLSRYTLQGAHLTYEAVMQAVDALENAISVAQEIILQTKQRPQSSPEK